MINQNCSKNKQVAPKDDLDSTANTEFSGYSVCKCKIFKKTPIFLLHDTQNTLRIALSKAF